MDQLESIPQTHYAFINLETSDYGRLMEQFTKSGLPWDISEPNYYETFKRKPGKGKQTDMKWSDQEMQEFEMMTHTTFEKLSQRALNVPN